MLPLLLLVVSLAGCTGQPGSAPAASAPTTQATAVTAPPTLQPPQVIDTPGDGFGMIRGLATPWAVPGGPGEPTPTPESPAVASGLAGDSPAITLQGPPTGSAFSLGDTISFYWTLDGSAPNGQMTLYVEGDAGRAAAGAVARANLGPGFQLSVAAGDIVDEAGTYRWIVVLEDSSTGEIINQSEVRPITIIGEN